MTWDMRNSGDYKLSENDVVLQLWPNLIGGMVGCWRSFAAQDMVRAFWMTNCCSFRVTLSNDERYLPL